MITVGMILFPRLTQLDLTGPYEVFARMRDTHVHLAAASPDPVRSEHGLAILPDTTFDAAPRFDILCVPGGTGINDRLDDEPFLAFLRRQGEQARFVTAVCTGALLLGAAGLLRGYRATTHWLSLDLLRLVGAEPVAERVVIDRNRITGGGVTAGIDFALTVASLLQGEAVAREIQLMMEYDPQPPFRDGSPRTADAATIQRVTASRQRIQDERRRKIEQLAGRPRDDRSGG
jgi:cyclohexyl-isocyanide hydratase